MANGRLGDHPLTDVIHYKSEIYGRKADHLIRKIAELSSERELNERWNDHIGGDCEPAEVLRRATARNEELVRRAKESRWETDD